MHEKQNTGGKATLKERKVKISATVQQPRIPHEVQTNEVLEQPRTFLCTVGLYTVRRNFV
jgi:hypothetical protein